jgi:hypothetical protein
MCVEVGKTALDDSGKTALMVVALDGKSYPFGWKNLFGQHCPRFINTISSWSSFKFHQELQHAGLCISDRG